MKRKHLVFLLCLLPVLAWAGGQAETAAESGPTALTFYLWEDPTYQNVVDTFNASQDEITVDSNYIAAGDYETKISTLLAGGTAMDGYMQKRSTDMFAHVANGYVEPLDALIKKHGFDIDAISAYKSQVSVDGKTYGLPFRGSSYYTYFNKKVFDAAGEPYPTTYVEKGEWTWDKFMEVAGRLATGDGEVYGGIIYTWGSNNAMPAHQRGIQFITKDGKLDVDDSALHSMNVRKQLEATRAIIPLLELKVTKTHYSQAFYNGNAGMLLIGEWFPGFMIKGRDENLLQGFTWDDWAITRLPCDEPTYRSWGAATFNHVHSRSQKKDAAFKFIAWMGGPEGAEQMALNGFLPPMITPGVKQALQESIPDAQSLQYFTEDKPVNAPWYNKYGSQVESLFGTVLEEYLTDGISEAQVMPTLKKGLEDIIASTD